ncbi:MAG: peptidyl-prolyl cis-trans isomerase [Holophagales bacterium]|nr:peptidyl-prolyl cis-trans isomerase [Holophagales bacterium]
MKKGRAKKVGPVVSLPSARNAVSGGVLLASLLLAACAGPPPGPAPGPDAVAVWDGGEVGLIEVEDVLRALPTEERERREAAIFDAYREVAREIALLRLLLPGTADPGERLAVWRAERPAAYRHLAAQLYAAEEILGGEAPEIPEEELETFYRQHPERFHQAPRRLLRHVFRRALGEGESGEDPLTVLAQVRARALAGEPFEDLARAWSQSENRRRGGEVGWVERGMLPQPLEDAVFALGRGELSDPIPGEEGALLFYVEDAVEEKDFPFEDVRLPLRRLLLLRRANEQVAAAARDIPPPEGAVALEPEEITAAADDAVVLRVPSPTGAIGGLEVRKSELPAELVERPRQLAFLLESRRLQALLWVQAERSGFTDRPDIRRRLTQSLDASLRRLELGQHLDAAARERLGELEAEVRALYDADPRRFAGPLRFRLHLLSIPLAEPGGQMQQLEALHGELAAGTITLEEAAGHLDGELTQLGWKSFAELAELDSKERVYVLDLGGPGFTLPYRLGRSLRILQVVERQAPRPLPWEEAREPAREEYLRQHRDVLWQEAATEILDAAGYRYLEENVRTALAVEPPAGTEQNVAAP